MIPRKKWTKEARPLQVGDLVYLVDPDGPRNLWPKGLINEVCPGRDGRTRMVKIRTKSGVLTRSAARVARVPIEGLIVSYVVSGAGALSKLRRLALRGAVSCISWSPMSTALGRHSSAGLIVSYVVSGAGALSKLRRLALRGAVSCISWSPWLARHPALLVNANDNSLYLFRIADRDGSLVLKKRFDIHHSSHSIRSTFCPIMSFRRGVCVVSGSEDSCVYFLDIEGHAEQPIVNKLQGMRISFKLSNHLFIPSKIAPHAFILTRGICTRDAGK
ncbi:unnamed protein product [Plutella xylostella]|uniref:(diamondback moth) hypothetical protein n=1 Tax=Plutella xylostella TaxID=51655 RepID=A0A8S4D339_PLUXY|nr:unnamed protein product [Plutella xylostella]